MGGKRKEKREKKVMPSSSASSSRGCAAWTPFERSLRMLTGVISAKGEGHSTLVAFVTALVRLGYCVCRDDIAG
jgi:hypothetical protein